jgi:hypothetical protein
MCCTDSHEHGRLYHGVYARPSAAYIVPLLRHVKAVLSWTDPAIYGYRRCGTVSPSFSCYKKTKTGNWLRVIRELSKSKEDLCTRGLCHDMGGIWEEVRLGRTDADWCSPRRIGWRTRTIKTRCPPLTLLLFVLPPSSSFFISSHKKPIKVEEGLKLVQDKHRRLSFIT